MAVELNDPDACSRTAPAPPDPDIPALRENPLSFARGCLVATAASAVLWLLVFWLFLR